MGGRWVPVRIKPVGVLGVVSAVPNLAGRVRMCGIPVGVVVVVLLPRVARVVQGSGLVLPGNTAHLIVGHVNRIGFRSRRTCPIPRCSRKTVQTVVGVLIQVTPTQGIVGEVHRGRRVINPINVARGGIPKGLVNHRLRRSRAVVGRGKGSDLMKS